MREKDSESRTKRENGSLNARTGRRTTAIGLSSGGRAKITRKLVGKVGTRCQSFDEVEARIFIARDTYLQYSRLSSSRQTEIGKGKSRAQARDDREREGTVAKRWGEEWRRVGLFGGEGER